MLHAALEPALHSVKKFGVLNLPNLSRTPTMQPFPPFPSSGTYTCLKLRSGQGRKKGCGLNGLGFTFISGIL